MRISCIATTLFGLAISVASAFVAQPSLLARPSKARPRRPGTGTGTGAGGLNMSDGDGPSADAAAVGPLDPSSTALVLIEYQNEFTTPGGKLHEAVKGVMDETNMLDNSRKLVEEARRAGCKIVHVPIAFEKGHPEINDLPYGILAGVKEGEAFASGQWGAEICNDMKPAEGDIVVKGKNGLCGFYSTNLDFILRQNRIDNVVIGGFLTNCCVDSTMRGAYERGYKVYTLKDCTATTSSDAQDAAIEHSWGMFSTPTTSGEVLEGIKRSTGETVVAAAA